MIWLIVLLCIILTVFLIVIIFDGETLTSFDKDELILKRIVDRVS